ncbi:MAG: sigma 54-interacting transcriptional regulator [Desulfopila sp.]|jgi:PAS domain S-box-containing protein|nr:sigma 54-interacting transcriptional regulator [Desulfopila sp.]
MDNDTSPTNNETRVILDSISDGVFTVDHEFRITSFNRAAEEITGFSRREAIGKRCSTIFQSNMCAGDCALKKTMTEHRSFVNSSTCITSRQGKVIPISVSTSLLKKSDDTILGGVETFKDQSRVEELKRELTGMVNVGKMVTRNQTMKQIFSILPQIGESGSTVLIEGETGTGKELLSRAIHSYSAGKDKPFVAINCGALPDTLLESELFGYKAGAFTGAIRDKPGLFAHAASGTVLLDELGDTSAAFQVKLLRLLEEKEFQPLGSTSTVKTEARIIAATNKNLSEMVESGTFRQDLYYRINVIHLKLPPLRQRSEDIPLLVEKCIEKMKLIKGGDITGISPEALAMLMSHTFPGNIRELENIVEHAFVICRRGAIQPNHFPPFLTQAPATISPQDRESQQSAPLHSAVYTAQRDIILEALKKNQYNRHATALSLGMHKSTLYRKMQKLNIQLPENDGRSCLLSPPSRNSV